MHEIEVENNRTGRTRLYTMRKGAFDVDNPKDARTLKDYGCFEPATRMSGRGWVCQGCGFVAVIRDHCGRCGSQDLQREE